MCAYRHTAAHMDYHQAQRLIWFPNLLRVSLRYGFLVQCVKNADTGKLRHAGIPGDGHQLIHNYRIYYVRRHTDGITDFLCQDTAQVGRMLSLNPFLEILQKFLRHSIGSSGNRLQHTAAPHDHIQALYIEFFGSQKVCDDILAEILLLYNIGKPADLLGGMP